MSIGELEDEQEVFEWIIAQKNDESIQEVDRETFLSYIDSKDFLAVVFCELLNLFSSTNFTNDDFLLLRRRG